MDTGEIIDTAAAADTSIEMNANPRCLDMDWRPRAAARAKGVKVNPNRRSAWGRKWATISQFADPYIARLMDEIRIRNLTLSDKEISALENPPDAPASPAATDNDRAAALT